MTERRLGAAVTVVASLLLVTGCASAPAEPVPTPTWVDLTGYDPERDANGLSLLAPADARTQILADAATADTSMTATFRDASGRVLDVAFTGSAQRFSAEVAVDGGTTSIVVDGARAAVIPSDAIAADAGLEAGAVACVAATDALITRWYPLLDPAAFIADATADASGLGAPADDAIELLLGEDGTAGVLRASTTGPALPFELIRADEAGSVHAVFSGWGDAEPVALPAAC
ncbi:hypothetical protein J2Y46_001758 [Microbacterium sp. BE35]|uniref:hypothetical protein n=1 Tax=Microbacterium sp. BE35 TaxID=2817773 RepID=UPI00285C36D9|nr:hypothetical protein [Microbacterium sp. BE35]MDR7188935.1 hypothetical protein [Microbacterium sp. BE35]